MTETKAGTDAVKTSGDKAVGASGSGVLSSEHGMTTIAETVVSKIAGIATREVDGVHNLGGGTARAVGMLRERIPGSRMNMAQGVGVEVGETQAAIDLAIVADYGVSIADLAQGVRRNVIGAVERMTGLEVTEVNIAVHDIHLEGDDEGDGGAGEVGAERRVQ